MKHREYCWKGLPILSGKDDDGDLDYTLSTCTGPDEDCKNFVLTWTCLYAQQLGSTESLVEADVKSCIRT